MEHPDANPVAVGSPPVRAFYIGHAELRNKNTILKRTVSVVAQCNIA
jgi:hypothetical protein